MRYLKLFESFQEVDNPHGGEFNYGNLSQDDITKIKSFIEDLKIYTKENNIKLVLSPEKGVQFSEGGIMCNGYFDDITSTLACALGKDVSQWLVILLHESCHMDQWIEKVPEWTENAGMDNIEKWLGGDNNVNMNNIDNEIRTSMIVEVDCERRTVEKIKKYGLQSLINIDEYIKKSNAYVLFYLWMRKNRKWYTVGKEPYNIPEIINIMPNKFDIDYSKMTPEIEKKFDSYLK
jgi:translation elongation factor EF-1beta